MDKTKDILERVPIITESGVVSRFEGLTAKIDGFNTVSDLIKALPAAPPQDIIAVVKALAASGKAVFRDEWSLLAWCKTCDTPLLGDSCGKCGAIAGEKIELKFSSNPRPVMEHDEDIFRAAGLPWPVTERMAVNHYLRPGFSGWELYPHGVHAGDIIFEQEKSACRFEPSKNYAPGMLAPGAAEASAMEDAVEANKERLEILEKEAVKLIKEKSGVFPFVIPVCTFSGGKDSAVMAHLCALSGVKMKLYQIDTGIDPECNAEFSRKFLERYTNFKVDLVRSGDMFWKAFEKLGPPASDFQWCRAILKIAAPQRQKNAHLLYLLKYIPMFLKPKLLIIDGPRRREEPWRVILKKETYVKNGYFRTLTIRPILDFTDYDIWMYIKMRALPVNPVYTEEKSQRMICLYCPDRTHRELEYVKQNRPRSWAPFSNGLKEWQKYFGFPDEWAEKNLWTFNAPVSAYMKEKGIVPRIEKIAERLNSVLKLDGVSEEGGEFTVRGRISGTFDYNGLARWLGAREKSRARVKILRSGELTITGKTADTTLKFAKDLQDWIVSYVNCIGCGICREHCSHFRLKDNKIAASGTARLTEERVKKIINACPVNSKGVKSMLSHPVDS